MTRSSLRPAALLLVGVLCGPAQAATQADFVSEGERLWKAGDLTAAAEQFAKASESAPTDLVALLKLGGVYLASRRYQESIDVFQRAIGMDANNADAFAALGLAYLHMGQLTRAHAAISQAVKLDPNKEASARSLLQNIERRAGIDSPSTH